MKTYNKYLKHKTCLVLLHVSKISKYLMYCNKVIRHCSIPIINVCDNIFYKTFSKCFDSIGWIGVLWEKIILLINNLLKYKLIILFECNDGLHSHKSELDWNVCQKMFVTD